ncbi:MAG: hypothetical protein JNL69_11680 [Bacteroidia bacterium]|nr:hypothetical protein [Bacteroidia bacterium]
MKEIFKKYCSILFLILFLFPQVEKEIHAFEHLNDFHCTATDKHFHELEHACSICDYTLSSSTETPQNNFIIVLVEHNHFYSLYTPSVTIPFSFQDIPARGPPLG